jgi:hypothetical protein
MHPTDGLPPHWKGSRGTPGLPRTPARVAYLPRINPAASSQPRDSPNCIRFGDRGVAIGILRGSGLGFERAFQTHSGHLLPGKWELRLTGLASQRCPQDASEHLHL